MNNKFFINYIPILNISQKNIRNIIKKYDTNLIFFYKKILSKVIILKYYININKLIRLNTSFYKIINFQGNIIKYMPKTYSIYIQNSKKNLLLCINIRSLNIINYNLK